MARKRFILGLVLIMLFCAAGVVAQSNDVTASLGRTFISDQGVGGVIANDTNIHFGDGISYSLSYARRLVDAGFASLSVEIPFVQTPETRLNFATNVVPKSFSAYYLAPSIRINLAPHFAFSPWVSGGGGFAHFSPSSTLLYGGTSNAKSSTEGALQIGAGLDIHMIGPIKLRGEVRDFFTGEPDFGFRPQQHMHNYFAGAGIVFSF